MVTGQIFNSTNPLTGRERFASARYLSNARLAIGFIAFVLIWSVLWILPLGIPLPICLLALVLGYVAAFGVVRYRYMFWKRRPIRLRCKKCRKTIITNTPWVCGYCRQPNLNPIEFPFVHKCENPECNLEPKTYRCHLCNRFIYLTTDEDDINFAYRFNSPKDITEADKKANILKEEREKKRDDHREKVTSKKEEFDLLQIAKDIAKVRQEMRETRAFGAKNAGDEDSLFERVKAGTEEEMEWDLVLKQLEKYGVEKYGKKMGKRWAANAYKVAVKMREQGQ